jgi:hypothetical protein
MAQVIIRKFVARTIKQPVHIKNMIIKKSFCDLYGVQDVKTKPYTLRKSIQFSIYW